VRGHPGGRTGAARIRVDEAELSRVLGNRYRSYQKTTRRTRRATRQHGGTRLRSGGVTLPGHVAGHIALHEVVLHGWDLAA
jgi:hypothetical protein